MFHFNRKQRLAIWASLIVILLFAAEGFWVGVGVTLAIGSVVVRRLAGAVDRPENTPVKSVRCGGCGAIGEPHWARCPKCGAADWKSE